MPPLNISTLNSIIPPARTKSLPVTERFPHATRPLSFAAFSISPPAACASNQWRPRRPTDRALIVSVMSRKQRQAAPGRRSSASPRELLRWRGRAASLLRPTGDVEAVVAPLFLADDGKGENLYRAPPPSLPCEVLPPFGRTCLARLRREASPLLPASGPFQDDCGHREVSRRP